MVYHCKPITFFFLSIVTFSWLVPHNLEGIASCLFQFHKVLTVKVKVTITVTITITVTVTVTVTPKRSERNHDFFFL